MIEIKHRVTGAILRKLDSDTLARADLTGANLAWANLAETNLRETNLTEADLTGANLTEANLAWANLTKANLAWANLTKANLIGANLRGANLTGADLTEADLTEADLMTRLAPQVLVISGSRDTIQTADPQRVHIGCYCHPLAEWFGVGKKLALAENYTTDQIAEYKSHLDHIEAWFAARDGGTS